MSTGNLGRKNQVFPYPSSLQEALLQQLQHHETMCFYNNNMIATELILFKKIKMVIATAETKQADGSLSYHLKKITFLRCCIKWPASLAAWGQRDHLSSNSAMSLPRNLQGEVTQPPVTHRALQRVPSRQTVMMESRPIILFPPGHGISASLSWRNVQEALGNTTKVAAGNGSILGEQATSTRK